MKPVLPADYTAFLEEIKHRIQTARIQAAQAANSELLSLYWDIGRRIVEKQQQEGWGAKIIDRLAADLKNAFPGIAGFSRANIYRMRAFYLAWLNHSGIVAQPVRQSGSEIVAPPVGQITSPLPPAVIRLPWGHHVILLQKIKIPATRLWYAEAALEHGWSRDVLALQIDSGLHARKGKAVTNFARTLPAPQSDLAQQSLKDPYIFDFLTLTTEAQERDVEAQLIQQVTRLLLELGNGFAFIGRQLHMEVGGEDFYLDMLFYHTRLHCYVVVDLKQGAFKPEYAGKMNFYLSAVDDQMRQPEDQPTIGLLLCRTRNRLIAEYPLRDVQKPIGIAAWRTRFTRALPKSLRLSLPAVDTIEQELNAMVRRGQKE